MQTITTTREVLDLLDYELSVTELTTEQLWEKQILKKMYSVFYSSKEPPILFKPKRNCELDFYIDQLIMMLNVRVPVMHIEKNMNLIERELEELEVTDATVRSLKGDAVLVRVEGGYERFENYPRLS